MTYYSKTFTHLDWSFKAFPRDEYDGCFLKNCHFYKADLSGYRFMDCRFESCNISMANLKDTAVQDCVFTDCKMLGLRFDECYGFNLSFRFENCKLDHSSFNKLMIKGSEFIGCSLIECDFTGCDLVKAVFENSDLYRAIFFRTDLRKADFSDAFNYSMDPEENRMEKAIFSSQGLAGLLEKYKIEVS